MSRAAPVPGVFGVRTTTFLVVANMVGTGVFTSLGFQIASIRSVLPLLALWAVGGAYALCGALSYGELAAAMPRSGGEYEYLSRTYHPLAGFLAGWISATVGFAAPVAAAAMALGKYVARLFPALSPTTAAVAAVVIVAGVQLGAMRVRALFQGSFTSFKVLLITAFVVGGFALATPQPVRFAWQPGDNGLVFSAPFAVSLVYVTYAYSGWNAAVYLAGEVADPGRDIPRSLVIGTSLVMVLYLSLNALFLYAAPMSAMAGQVEVGYIAAESILGAAGARVMGALISLGLVSSVSAMVWAGPRVLMVLGEDVPLFAWFARRNRHGVPHRAVLMQAGLAVILIATSTFESVITCLGFVLATCTFFTVVGLFVHRRRFPDAARPYRTWGFPLTPAFFLAVTGWMLVCLLRWRPIESLLGLGAVALGIPIYFWGTRALSGARSGGAAAISQSISPP
jgi:basic amino acid/polyamine antiporter, APA family